MRIWPGSRASARNTPTCSSWPRVKGIGEEYADLLELAGVDTVPALAQRNPDHLHKALVDLATARKDVVRRTPAASEVTAWIAAAKDLPRVINY